MGSVLRPAVHPVAFPDPKGSIKVIGGRQYGIYPGDARGMCVIGHDVGKVFIPVFCGPYDTIGMVQLLQVISLFLGYFCYAGNTSQVSDILRNAQRTVYLDAVYFHGIIVVNDLLGQFPEMLFILGSPPIPQVSLFIIL